MRKQVTIGSSKQKGLIAEKDPYNTVNKLTNSV